MDKQVYVDEMLEKMMFRVMEKDTTVVQYPYRTATINNTLMQFPRHEDFEEMLSQKANRHIDNHTVYEVSLKDGSTFAIMCHDAEMYFGLGITKENW